MAWDQQGYYQDPYQEQQYGQDQYGYGYGYDPNYGYGYDQNYGYGYQQPQEEDTESAKLRKDALEKERIEALESNRLYMKKIKKHCVKEEFADLDKLQLFLFEVLVENMEVNSESVLGLLTDKDQLSYISARVQFLNSPWMEICERDMMLEGTQQESAAETEYVQAIGEAGQSPYVQSYQESFRDGGHVTSVESQGEGEEGEGAEGEEGEEVTFTTKWENASGKSCLFSESALMIVRDLEKFPVMLQVLRCVVSKDGQESCEPIGYAQVRLPEDFSLSVIQSCKDGVILPVSSDHRATLDLRNVFGARKGRADLFLRLSCFGPVIITSFQSSGRDRKYVFKPSPLDSNFKTPAEVEPPARSDLLKPIITEEEKTVGITVQREYDFFQKPVLWKRPEGFDNCGCLDGSVDERVSRLSSLGSLRLPLDSDIGLCKDVLPPSVFRKLQFDNPTCDWHSLVSSGIKNSPGGNCGCLDSVPRKHKGKLGSACEEKRNSTPLPPGVVGAESRAPGALGAGSKAPGADGGDLNRKYSTVPSTATKVSRVYKMTLTKPSVEGFGLMKECTDCGCDCPTIRDALESKKLFLI